MKAVPYTICDISDEGLKKWRDEAIENIKNHALNIKFQGLLSNMPVDFGTIPLPAIYNSNSCCCNCCKCCLSCTRLHFGKYSILIKNYNDSILKLSIS